MQELLDNSILKDHIDRSNMGSLVEKNYQFNGGTDYLKSQTGDYIIRSAVIGNQNCIPLKLRNLGKLL